MFSLFMWLVKTVSSSAHRKILCKGVSDNYVSASRFMKEKVLLFLPFIFEIALWSSSLISELVGCTSTDFSVGRVFIISQTDLTQLEVRFAFIPSRE